MSSTNKDVFQLSVLSQNDSGAASGAKLHCVITKYIGGTLKDSSPLEVKLPVPSQSPPPTPTWFLIPDTSISEAYFTVDIFCPTEPLYPSCTIKVLASDVMEWGNIPYNERDNQIYQRGKYGIFGFAQMEELGPIYTITAGVLDPQLQG